jgi:hypothetical protein
MPDSQPPLVFFDNVYDRINQYPQAVLSSTAFVVGRDPKYVADYRRERSLWQAATALVNHAISVDLGVGITRAVSAIFIDRGHNLWGQTLAVIGSDDCRNHRHYSRGSHTACELLEDARRRFRRAEAID